MLTPTHLRAVLRAAPFRPFTLHLGSGRSVRVEHPEVVGFLGDGSTIAVSYPRTDHFELIPLMLVASVGVGAPRGRRRSA